jgi:hypothetical protein
MACRSSYRPHPVLRQLLPPRLRPRRRRLLRPPAALLSVLALADLAGGENTRENNKDLVERIGARQVRLVERPNSAACEITGVGGNDT